jgi:hypothetical protein
MGIKRKEILWKVREYLFRTESIALLEDSHILCSWPSDICAVKNKLRNSGNKYFKNSVSVF